MAESPHLLCLRVLCDDAKIVADWFEPLAATLGPATFRAYEDGEEPVVELYVDLDGRDAAPGVAEQIVEASLAPGAPGRATYVGVFRRASAACA